MQETYNVGIYCRLSREDERERGAFHRFDLAAGVPGVEVVHDIFQNYQHKTATTLNTEQVPTPSSFYYLRQGKPNIRKEGGYWQAQTVKAILQKSTRLIFPAVASAISWLNPGLSKVVPETPSSQ